MRGTIAVTALFLAAAVACAPGPPDPAALDTTNDSCSFCRMKVSDSRFASQIVAPGEEPLFFDDLGCLANFLREGEPRANGMIVYVADHRSGAWVNAGSALYSRCPGIGTPMDSHLVAHHDDASKKIDPAAAGCPGIAARELFGPGGPHAAK